MFDVEALGRLYIVDTIPAMFARSGYPGLQSEKKVGCNSVNQTSNHCRVNSAYVEFRKRIC